MGGLSIADLIRLHLDGGPRGNRSAETEGDGTDGSEPASYRRTVPGITDAIGERVGDSPLEVLSELSALVEEGHVEESVTSVEGRPEDRTVYRLTEAGGKRARSLREELAEREVRIQRNGYERRCSLGEIDEHVEAGVDVPGDDPLIGTLVALQDDDRLVLDGTESEEDAIVGRDHELAVLEELLCRDSARTDTHSGIVIAGPTGIGKTALVDAFAERVRKRGGVVLSGAAAPGNNEPYGPIKEALSTAPEADSSDPFGDAGDAVVEADSYEAYRQTLFAEIVTRVETIVGDEPALFFVDDLHWADPATLELFASLLADLDAERTAVVGTYNDSLVDDENRLATMIGRELDAGRLERLRLSALDRDELTALIQQELETPAVPAAFVDAIEELTGGNPLFLVECLRHLTDQDVLDPGRGQWPTDPTAIPLPETIDGIIETRLARLTEDELSILQSAAVIGERVPLSVLSAVTDRSEAALQEVASTFVEADLWTEVRAAELPLTRTFRFESAVARERVLETLDPDDRRDRHEAVAEALLSVNGQNEQDRHAAVARQYERAGHVDDAIEHYREAAAHATDVYAHDCALAALDRAYELASEHDRETARDELRLEMAERWYLVGEYDRAADHVKHVYDRATDPERLQRALARLAKVAVAQGAFDRAIELATEGVELSAECESVAICQLLHAKCMAEWRQGRCETASETARKQQQLATELDDRSLVADALHDLGTIRLQQGAYTEAEARFEDELAIRRELDDRHGVAKTLGNMGIVAQHLGELKDTLEYYERSLEEFRTVGSQYDVATVLNNLGTIALEGGELDRAQVYLEESLDCFQRLDIRDGIALVLTNIGNLARARGNVETARTYHQDGLELARELGSRHLVAENVDGLGLLAAAEGDLHRARESFEESLAIKHELGVTHGIAQTLTDLGDVCLDLGAYDRAREHLEEAEQLAGEVGDPTLVADCRSQLGALAIHERELTAATRWFDGAIEALEDAGTLGTDRARPLDRLDELLELAVDAGYDDAAADWCQRLTNLLDRRDDDVDEERFADPRARSPG